jgi:uncharacterized protein YbgA (DUF1722 family)
VAGNASGFFGGPVSERFSHLAVENEGRLNSFTLREHFYTRLFALARFRSARHAGGAAELVRYHTENKFILLMYNQKAMREMGRAVANLEKRPVHEAYRLYEGLLHHALSKVPRFASAVNVLMHAQGYFAKGLSAREKAYFLDTLEQFRAGRVPLSVCSAIVKSWIARFGEKYLDAQTFFNPYPESLIDITDSGKGRGL